jgi:hypothetical protein
MWVWHYTTSINGIHVLYEHDIHLQVLGKGAFGIVYAAEDKHGTETFACKSIAKAKLVSEVSIRILTAPRMASTISDCLELSFFGMCSQ